MRINMNAVLIAPFFTVLLLALPVSSYADWSNTGMHPALSPNLNPAQVQPVHHEIHVNAAPAIHFQPQNHIQSPQPVRHDRPVEHRQDVKRPEQRMPVYFRHDVNFYGHVDVVLPYSDVDSPFVVPDGFELVTVNGETFYYNQGVFYQQVGNQLTAIPAVLGAVVDYIPQDYQIVMADGTHYLFTGGVYYQRVDQGFEVVQGP